MMDDRAVSVQFGYTLTLSISAVLVVGLLIATGGLVESQQEQAVRDQLTVVGERVASHLMAADRLVSAGGTELRLSVSLPAEVAGTGYRITVDDSTSPSQLVLRSDSPTVEVSVPFETAAAVDAGATNGGDLEIVLVAGSSTLEIRSA